jgi:hypothetical protein
MCTSENPNRTVPLTAMTTFLPTVVSVSVSAVLLMLVF